MHGFYTLLHPTTASAHCTCLILRHPPYTSVQALEAFVVVETRTQVLEALPHFARSGRIWNRQKEGFVHLTKMN